MRVLIACEESQAVAIAFRNKGHDAYSCDILPCSGGHPEWHIQWDAIEALWSQKWDLVIAHPPCDRLTNSGVRWLEERNLWNDLYDACTFFNHFTLYGKLGNRIAIENPVPHKHAVKLIGKYNQIIQPYQFGHTTTKKTCLWLFGLPPLIYTCIVPKEQHTHEIHTCSPGPDRKKIRSKTFPGIAEAMANQWGIVP